MPHEKITAHRLQHIALTDPSLKNLAPHSNDPNHKISLGLHYSSIGASTFKGSLFVQLTGAYTHEDLWTLITALYVARGVIPYQIGLPDLPGVREHADPYARHPWYQATITGDRVIKSPSQTITWEAFLPKLQTIVLHGYNEDEAQKRLYDNE